MLLLLLHIISVLAWMWKVVNAGLVAVAVFAVVVVVVTIHFCAVAVPNVIAECREGGVYH